MCSIGECVEHMNHCTSLAVPCAGAAGTGWNRLCPAQSSPGRPSRRPLQRLGVLGQCTVQQEGREYSIIWALISLSPCLGMSLSPLRFPLFCSLSLWWWQVREESREGWRSPRGSGGGRVPPEERLRQGRRFPIQPMGTNSDYTVCKGWIFKKERRKGSYF